MTTSGYDAWKTATPDHPDTAPRTPKPYNPYAHWTADQLTRTIAIYDHWRSNQRRELADTEARMAEMLAEQERRARNDAVEEEPF